MSVLKATNLSKSYKRRLVVKGVSLEIQAGEIIGLLGRNGAGKTTTFQMIVGLVKPDDGSISFDGRDISRSSTPERARLGITYLPQENSVFLKASVEDNLRLILELLPYEEKEKENLRRQLLEELDLLALAKQSAHSLSGGERRKLEICRSLILKPKFLLLDEPFTGIDPLTVIDLQKIMLNLKNRDIAIIISDHNVRDTLRITDRAYILDEGEVLIEGTPARIAADEGARKKFLGKDFELAGTAPSPPQKNNDLPGFLPGNKGKGKNRAEAESGKKRKQEEVQGKLF
jgi:lipopolysaccharide export system ATP-binding protein